MNKRFQSRRAMAAILCAGMAISALTGCGRTAQRNGDSQVTRGVTREADPSTMDDYMEILDLGANTRYAGRLWSDKSVFAYGAEDAGDRKDLWDGKSLTLTEETDGTDGRIPLDSDFLHVYSVLGSSLQVDEPVPTDLVLALDISGSMNRPLQDKDDASNRMDYAIRAANEFIHQYLSISEKNRIAIVTYDSVATVLLPLAHYEQIPDKAYLAAETHHGQPGDRWACTVSATAIPKSGYEPDGFPKERMDESGIYHASVTSRGGTATALALSAGLDILASVPDTYGDLYLRKPVLVLMGDGNADAISTGLAADDTSLKGDKTKTLTGAWTRDTWKTITDPGDRYNDSDPFPDAGPFEDRTSHGLTVYGAGYGHLYTPETDDGSRCAIVLNTLLNTAYQKALVERHYNNDRAYDEADADTWKDASVYTIGFGPESYGGTTERTCMEILDPASHLDAESIGSMPESTQEEQNSKDALTAMMEGYEAWRDGTKEDNPYVPSLSLADGTSVTLGFPTVRDDREDAGTGITKADIDRNVRYNKAYFAAAMEKDAGDRALDGVFDDILVLIQNEAFQPIGGNNDLGAENAITYVDSIGEYMEVKDVKDILLLGELHGVKKTAIYDHAFVDAYIKEHGGEETNFENGWYRKGKDGSLEKSDRNSESWKDGWEYYVNTVTAMQFLPTEPIQSVEDLLDPSEKMRRTRYTFYRLDMEEKERAEVRKNPAYSGIDPDDAVFDTANPGAEDYYGKIPGFYRLSDLRIWTEDVGDYVDDENGTITDTDYETALCVNLPVSMVPLRKVTIFPEREDGAIHHIYDDQGDGFPLRIFYTVGIKESVLTKGREIDVTGAIDKGYAARNEIKTKAAAKGRNLDIGDLEFFSTWYNPTNRYDGYMAKETDYTYGNAVTSFSPDPGNQYYVFDEPSPIYSKAYRYQNGTWQEVTIGDGSEGNDPDTFHGRLLASGLSVAEETPGGIGETLENRRIEPEEGDVVLLANARIADSNAVHRGDTFDGDFTAQDYYFIALGYFGKDGNGRAQETSIVVARKGSQFGSGYASAGLKNGELLCWYDLSGRHAQTYPYLSRTETGIQDRGRSHIGLDIRCDADGKPLPATDYTEGERTEARAIQEDGTWVIAAKKGGLRISDLAGDVRSKGTGYEDYDPDFIEERYGGGDELTWRCAEGNLTRTANNYYLPTISPTQGTGTAGSSAIINCYLGNNGRLWLNASDAAPAKTKE